jgi:hypothetical protein
VPRPAAPARPPIYPTKQQFDSSADAQRHVAVAKQLAGNDLLPEFENTCSFTGPERAALKRERLGLPPMKDYTVEPTKIFDNVWFVGLASQGAFVITTSQGLILIDTLNTTEEARDILVPSMQKVGLDPGADQIHRPVARPSRTDRSHGRRQLPAEDVSPARLHGEGRLGRDAARRRSRSGRWRCAMSTSSMATR